MSRAWISRLVFVILALLIIVLATGVRRVPAGREGVLAHGDLRVYRPGWYITRPGTFVLFPSGRHEIRYPAEGDRRIMTRDGLPVRGAFLFELEIPQGSADDLYRLFGTDFTARLERMLLDAIEIAAARYRLTSDDDPLDPLLTAISDELGASLSDTPVSVLKVEAAVWSMVETHLLADITEEPPRKIVCIGVDGGDWQIIHPMIGEGLLPNFARFVEQGATGPLLSMEPMLSPLLWTTMATGKLPEEHGILNFTAIDPETGEKIPITRMYRKVDAFWNMMSDYGRTVDIVGWLVT